MNKLLKTMTLVAGLAVGSSFATAASAAPWVVGQWYELGGNYYSVQQVAAVDNTTSWLLARDQATALTAPGQAATLATIESAAVDAFVFAGIDDASFWTIDSAGNNEGPYLGGYQTSTDNEPAGNWAWVNGDAWDYTQWNPGEPNNSNGNENFMQFFGNGSSRSGNWNDGGGAASIYGTSGAPIYYIAESKALSVSGVPEPTSWAMMIAGLGLAGASMRRRTRVASLTA